MSNLPGNTSGFLVRVEHVVQDADFAVGTLDQYVLLVWRQTVSLAGAQAAAMSLNRLHAQRPKVKLGFITLLDRGCTLSASAEVRQLMAATLKTHRQNIGAAAIAYELDGFWSAITRSVITAINVASRVAFPNEVTSDLKSAIDFVTRELRDGSDTRRLGIRNALETLRAGERTGERTLPRAL